jgi:glycosyltransferase involved in cell wall biosynthesis
MTESIIRVIIPAFNEEASIGLVLKDVPELVRESIVISNNSTDQTESVAKKNGATVLSEPRRGYGYACLKGMDYVSKLKEQTDVIVFLDGDYSDYPEELSKIVAPILNDNYDFVIGARVKHLREKGSMTFPQIFGNWLATFLMRILYGAKYSDLGPFRAIKYNRLIALQMEDKTYGWTVEMQLKALKHKLKYTEVEVNYRNRIGESKVSGTVKGAVMAGVKIIGWIFKYTTKR